MAAVPLTDGRIYFIESDAGDNQDWIGANGGDPDAIDLTPFLEGTEYTKLELPEGFQDQWFTGISVTDVGGGKSFARKFGRRFYRALASGFESTLTNYNLVKKFFMLPRHTVGDTSFTDYHLIVYFGTNLHLEFLDSGGNVKSYCSGFALNGAGVWNKAATSWTVRINWKSVW